MKAPIKRSNHNEASVKLHAVPTRWERAQNGPVLFFLFGRLRNHGTHVFAGCGCIQSLRFNGTGRMMEGGSMPHHG